MQIDLNCDMGEGFGAWNMGQDAAVMQHITSANIACGFHAGDFSVMQKTVRLALQNGVAIGAHPGFPDLQGFGRRNMDFAPDEIEALVLYQTGALAAIAKAEGGTVRHVKPHGALYNMAAKTPKIAEAIARAVYKVSPTLLLYGLSGSALTAAGQAMGLPTAAEVFADRTYQDDGTLTPRQQPGAVLTDPEQVAKQALEIVRDGQVTAVSGKTIPLQADTLCLHGDGPHALSHAVAIRTALEKVGVRIAPVGQR
jgi:UPF0271 protein